MLSNLINKKTKRKKTLTNLNPLYTNPHTE